MRFTLRNSPTFLLISTTLFIAYYGYGLFMTLIFLALWFLVRLAIVNFIVRTNVAKLIKKQPDPLIFESLPISHYVDKVRWCLDRLGVPYEREDDVGILGIVTQGRFVS